VFGKGFQDEGCKTLYTSLIKREPIRLSSSLQPQRRKGYWKSGITPLPPRCNAIKLCPCLGLNPSSVDNKTRTLTQFCLEGYTVRSLHLPRDTPGPGILRSLMGYYHHTRVSAQPVCHQDSNPSRRPDNNQAKKQETSPGGGVVDKIIRFRFL